MAKYYGKIGYVDEIETSPGVWKKVATECNYYGNILQANIKWDSTSEVNNDININNQISIVADNFAITNSHLIKYVIIQGVKWKVTNITFQHPRLILTIGGLYNGQ